MADNTDQADTSVNDEVLESGTDDPEFDLENSDISWDTDDDGSEQEDTDGETPEAEASDEADEPEEPEETTEDVTEEVEAEEAEAATEAEDTPAEETKGEPDPDKAREAFLRRKIQREEREKQERATLEQYLRDAGDDETEQQRRLVEVEKYQVLKERAQLNEERLSNQVLRAKAEIPLLSSNDPVVLNAFGDALDDFQRMHVRTNEYGDVLEVTADVYQYLQSKAALIEQLTGVGKRQESKAKAKQTARTLAPPTRAPKEKAVDPDLAAFDEEAYRWDD